MISYRTLYRDSLGEIRTSIQNDGKILRMSLLGVEFEGSDFDSLAMVGCKDPKELARFSLTDGALCACSLQFEMPVTVIADGGDRAATLEADQRLGRARPPGSQGGDRRREAAFGTNS